MGCNCVRAGAAPQPGACKGAGRSGADGPHAGVRVERRTHRAGSRHSLLSYVSTADDLPATAGSLLSFDMAAGHPGSVLKYVDKSLEEVPLIPSCIMKVYNETEALVYKELAATNDSLLPFVATFYGEVDPSELLVNPDCGRYMRLSNLVSDFDYNPHVMDCKLGVRSFSEEEVMQTKRRNDLYLRLLEMDPSVLTEEERREEACTKFRWMEFNDRHTTMNEHGFRVDGIQSSQGRTAKPRLWQMQNLQDVAQRIYEDFLPASSSSPTASVKSWSPTNSSENGKAGSSGPEASDGDPHSPRTSPAPAAAAAVLRRLRAMREAMEASKFVKSHTFIGCSLFFVSQTSGPSAGVFLIDFAHTTPVPEGIAIDHRSPWRLGNHEDGLLIGMDNMIRCWEEVVLLSSGGKPTDCVGGSDEFRQIMSI